MKIVNIFLISFLFLITLSTGVMAQDVTIGAGSTLAANNINMNFNNDSSYDSVIAQDNELDYQYGLHWNNVSANTSTNLNLGIDHFSPIHQNFSITPDNLTANSQLAISGFNPYQQIMVNGNSVTADINGGILVNSSGINAYSIGPNLNFGNEILCQWSTLLTIPVTILPDVDHVNWFVNGKQVTNGVDTIDGLSLFTYPFVQTGAYKITAVQLYANGTAASQKIVIVNVLREMANVSFMFHTVSQSVDMNTLEQAIVTLNATAVMAIIPLPFTGLIGNMFYGFIFALPMVFLWINQRKLTMPTTLFLLFGFLVIGLIPPEFHYAIWIMVVVSFSVPFLKFIHPDR